MKPSLEELLARIHDLQEEVEDSYRDARQDWELKAIELAGDFRQRQREFKTGLWRFLITARPLVVLTAPVIYLGWIPFMLMDLFITVYQAVCFPVYGIPKVKRSDFLVFDRELLPYLNIIEKFNCFYCAYGNGIAAYACEVAARTEQYWCPIKHARRIRAAHRYYPKFLDHGDAETYRKKLEELRKDYEDIK